MEELSFVLRNSWLIPAIPFVSFAVVGLVIAPISKKAAGIVATAAIFASALLAYWVAWDYFHSMAGREHSAIIPFAFEWLRYQAGLSVCVGVFIDPISVLLMIVVTT